MTGSDWEALSRLPEAAFDAFLARLSVGERQALAWGWALQARPEQRAPPGDWRLWLVMAGRGFGKTRAGAEWVREIAERDGAARIALVSATPEEARAVMVEGESGLLAIAPPDMRPNWQPALGRLHWPSGASARIFGASSPDSLRGPQFTHGWADEIAKWARGEAAWDNLAMATRLGEAPRLMATTTPRPVPLLRRLLRQDDVVVTRGRTMDNAAHLPAAFLAAMRRDYGGTRLGRQELDGELIADLEGALWSRALIERCRDGAGRAETGRLRRVVVGVDPPAGTGGDACGIVVAALTERGQGLVLADMSVEGAHPEGWARAVARAAAGFGADRVIAEANNGGAMVESVLRAADAALPVRLVHASRGKSARAEPVATLYEAGKVTHCGAFPALEDQLCGMMIDGGYEGPGRSPDRADALVWALSALMLGQGGGEARIRRV
jgi:phage terminase large subunit-like protein